MATEIDLIAIKRRADLAAPELKAVFRNEETMRPVRASARDVPALLAEVIDLRVALAQLQQVVNDHSG